MNDKKHDMTFRVITGKVTKEIINNNASLVIQSVKDAYVSHYHKNTSNPQSQFLRFKDNHRNRIISLPSSIIDDNPISGMKWISSYPNNINKNIQRASAVYILNDYDNGYPIACIEASSISYSRTAASTVLASELYRPQKKSRKLVVIGCGIIARETLKYYSDWSFEKIVLHDLNSSYARQMYNLLDERFRGVASIEDDLAAAVYGSDHILFTTTAGTPYFDLMDRIDQNALILHVSLRDICEDMILKCCNVVDDIDHCLRENTSVHLSYLLKRDHEFIKQTIPQALVEGPIATNGTPLVISPFGMGILDLAVARMVYQEAISRYMNVIIDDFFYESDR